LTQAFAVIAAVLLAAALRYSAGFGFSLAFVPLATLVIGFPDAVRLAVLFEVLVGALTAYVYRRELRVLDAFSLKAAALCGAALGTWLKPFLPAAVVIATSMGVIVLLCISLLWNLALTFRPSTIGRMAAGLSSGWLNSWSSMSGPPIVLYLLATDKSASSVKGRLVGYFALLYPVTLALMARAGEYKGFRFWPLAAAGLVLIAALHQLLRRLEISDVRRLRQTALIVILAAATVVLVKGLM
jgi:hypothetical protein